MTNNQTVDYKFLVPFLAFPYQGDDFAIDEDLSIQRARAPFDHSVWQGFFSKDDLLKLTACSHHIILNVRQGGYPRPKELISLFQLALWLARPTRAYTPFRLVTNDKHQSVFPSAARIYDTYQWLRADVRDTVNDTHLRQAAKLFRSIKQVAPSGGRLYTALTYAHYGCTTIRWQVAFAMYSASLETLFYHNSKGQVTKTLGSRTACFLENTSSRRIKLYNKVLHIYDVRSAILHGRYIADLEDHQASNKNLADLKLLSVTLRRIWRKLLLNHSLISTFNSNDHTRNAFLDSQCIGFHPN